MIKKQKKKKRVTAEKAIRLVIPTKTKRPELVSAVTLCVCVSARTEFEFTVSQESPASSGSVTLPAQKAVNSRDQRQNNREAPTCKGYTAITGNKKK